MANLDDSRPFIPLNMVVLTISDTRDSSNDKSGELLVGRIEQAGHMVHDKRIIRDDQPSIEKVLRECVENSAIDVVIATGGTGLTGRDVTPEAFFAVYQKEIPGFGELFRALSYDIIGTSTLQSRATAGVASGTYLFALPGSPSACRDAWDKILQYQLDNRLRPCNLVEILPRLTEN